MSELYEEAFARIFADELDVEYKNIEQVYWTFEMGKESSVYTENQDSKSSGMQPDIYVKSEYLDCFDDQDTAIVADTKWKTTSDNEVIINKKGVQNTPDSTDVQQITAYRDIAREQDNNGTVYGVLIYPYTSNSSDSTGNDLVELSCGDWGGIYLVGWNVQSPTETARNVIKSIKNID
jgi:hypothetical protein